MRAPAIRARTRSPRATCADARRPRCGAPRRSAAIDMPTSSDRAGRLREQQHQHAEHEAERDPQAREHADHRVAQRRRRGIAPQAVRPAPRGRARPRRRRRSTAASTSATSMSSRHMRVEPAAPQVMALADAVARHGDVVRRPRTVARRTRRPVDADDRRADGRGDVRRPGVARHHQRRAARERDEIGDRRSAARGSRRRPRRRRPPRRALLRRVPTARPTSGRAARAAPPRPPPAAPAASACSATPRRD